LLKLVRVLLLFLLFWLLGLRRLIVFDWGRLVLFWPVRIVFALLPLRVFGFSLLLL
jgi:hypothetical protein